MGRSPTRRGRPRSPRVSNAGGEALAASRRHLRAGHLVDAEGVLRAALAAGGPRPDLHFALAEVLSTGRRLGEAVESYRAALALAPGDAGGHLHLGVALRGIGHLTGAVDAYRRAIALDPASAEARSILAGTLAELGRPAEALEECRLSLELAPGLAEAHLNLGNVLVALGQTEAGIASLRHALELAPGFALAAANLGSALRRAGRLDEAIAALRRAVLLAPDAAEIHARLGRALLEAGETAAALAVCDAYLAGHPGSSGMIALEVLALRRAGDLGRARALDDPDRFVRARRLPVPPGFRSGEAFHAALARHVSGHPTLSRAPESHATKDGLHSGSLLVPPKGPVAALEDLVNDAVADYWRSIVIEPGHRFLGSKPHSVALDMWAVVLEAGGRQIPHIHPDAWLSGVYYVELPPALADGNPSPAPGAVLAGTGKPGWIEFGSPDPDLGVSVEHEPAAVRPEQGLLVLFPSYLYHRTVPFETAGTRISIAFDVIPGAAPPRPSGAAPRAGRSSGDGSYS